MSSFEVTNASLSMIFEVQIQVNGDADGEVKTVHFKIPNKSGKDASVSFDGKNWYPACLAYQAMKAFEDRFPMAFEEGLDDA